MTLSVFSKGLITYCSTIGAYGFYRGFRSKERGEEHRLLMDRFTTGFANGLMYSAPFFNFVYISRLMNRLEIEYRELNPQDYTSEYKEINGYCMDTW